MATLAASASLILATLLPTQAETIPKPRGYLWSLRLPNSSATIHLLGGVSFLQASDYPLPAAIEEAYATSPIVVLETCPSNSPEEESRRSETLLKAGQLPEGQTLPAVLPPPLWRETLRSLDHYQLSENQFAPFRPWMAALALVSADFQTRNLNPRFTSDADFAARAAADGKRTIPLETLDFETQLLTGMSPAEQEDFLRQTLARLHLYDQSLPELRSAWLRGDAPALEKFADALSVGFPLAHRRLVLQRTQSWVPALTYLAQGSSDAFVIVSFEHLPGENGLLQLLSKKGMQVTQN